MNLKKAGIPELIKMYTEAASRHGAATESGDYKEANRQHDVVAKVYRELRRRGSDAQRALLPLLAEQDLGVRTWAAAHALEFAPAEGKRVLAAAAEVPNSLVSLSAKMTLREWEAGRLRFP